MVGLTLNVEILASVVFEPNLILDAILDTEPMLDLVHHPQRHAMLAPTRPDMQTLYIIQFKALITLWHPHIRIYCCRERREASTPQRRRLGTSFKSQRASSDTAGRYGIRQVALRPVTLYTTLRPAVHRTDQHEVLRRAIRSFSHIFETYSDLFAGGKFRHCLALW